MADTTPERKQCLAVLQRWKAEGGRHVDELISDLCAENSGSRAFVQNLCYGTIRNLALLDHWIAHLAGAEREIDPRTRSVLRLGLYELLRTRTPDHASVNEWVTLAGRARGFVNALLRRATRERNELEKLCEEAPPAIRLSHPGFLLDRWTNLLGEKEALALCAWNQDPAPVYVRENQLNPPDRAELELVGDPVEEHPGFWLVRDLPRAHLDQGQVYAQDPSTSLACLLLDPKPGQRILDACAAPGGKSALLAQLMENRGQLVATDPKPARLERLASNLGRLGVECAECHPIEWGTDLEGADLGIGEFDRILIDAPCTNTGVFRRRADARWRIEGPETFSRMAELQGRILDDTSRYLRKGGRLVYSTCSLEPEENRRVIEAFLARHPDWILEEEQQSQPQRDGYDGAYAAALRREKRTAR